MTRRARRTLACIAALLLAGHVEAVQAQQKGRAREKPAPADNKSLLIDAALQSSSVRTQLALVRSRMKPRSHPKPMPGPSSRRSAATTMPTR